MRVGMMTMLLAACGSGEVHYTRGLPEESEADADTDADADGDADTDVGEYEIAIGGTWVDSLGIGNLVTDETWTWHYAGYPDTVFEITQFENDPGLAIVHETEANDSGDKLWGRFDWTWMGDVPYICHATESVPDEETAISAPAPDRDDLTSGCGGFEWWQLTRT